MSQARGPVCRAVWGLLEGSAGALQVDSGLAMAVLLLSQLPNRPEGSKDTRLKTGLQVTNTQAARMVKRGGCRGRWGLLLVLCSPMVMHQPLLPLNQLTRIIRAELVNTESLWVTVAIQPTKRRDQSSINPQ